MALAGYSLAEPRFYYRFARVFGPGKRCELHGHYLAYVAL